MRPSTSAAGNPPPDVPALERAIGLLRRLEGCGVQGMRAKDLQKALGAPRASFFRIVGMLCEAGWIAQDPSSGRYRLGFGLQKLGYAARNASPLVRAAQEVLRDLARATHLMSELAVAVGPWTLVMLDVWQAEGTPVKVVSRPGLEFKLDHRVAHGLCYLAFDGARRFERYVQNAAAQGSDLPASLFERMQRARNLGYAWALQSGYAGRSGNARAAVPVFDPHSKPRRLAGTLGLVCDNADMSALRAAQWAQVLKEKAAMLESAL